MIAAASQPGGAQAVHEAPLAATREVRLTRRQGFLLALGSLAIIYGLALGVMLLGGVVVHAISPARHIDIFAALHHWWVVGPLLGIAVLWLVPPYPWAKWLVASASREQQTEPDETKGGGSDTVPGTDAV